MEKEILKTLVYSDIFDYPLTGNQIFQTIALKKSRKNFLTNLKKIPHVIKNNLLYYFLPGRESIVYLRKQREKYSRDKIAKVKKIIPLLRCIPTIRFIGISGSVAILNADKKSDIDLFFITSPNSVWITRFFVYSLLQLLGVRREKTPLGGVNTHKPGTVCPNMFLDADHMRFPVQKRNLYLAHEIVQLFPLLNKNKIYEKFMLANSWIQQYFPNLSIKPITKMKSISFSFLPLEFLMRKAQLWYMGKNKTREITTPFVIAFHPIDYEAIIMDEYEKRLRKYKI